MEAPTEEQIKESRKKFAENFGKVTQIGGKGAERRKHPVKHRGNKSKLIKKSKQLRKNLKHVN